MSTVSRREFSLQLDTATPTSSSIASNTLANTLATSTAAGNACSTSSDCADSGVCSNGSCTGSSVDQAAPFAPAGSSGVEQTTHLDTATATGIGVGVAVFIVLLVFVGFWFFKKRSRRQPIASPEAPPATRDRSASTATKWTIDNDQRTLVASLPNSPQHAAFARQHPGLPSEFYTTPGKVIEDEEKREGEKEVAEYRQGAVRQSEETPTSPVDKALPKPPAEEKRYAINVNINKSMIFDDIMFNAAVYAASPVPTPHDRAPRYLFEEDLPPVPPSNPRISITKTVSRASSTVSSEYELENYPHGSSYIGSNRNSKSDAGSLYSDSQGSDSRGTALSKLEGGLSLPELPPPSPSLSFRSYDWYQDIIGGDQSAVEQQPPELQLSDVPTPELPQRNPARAVNPLLSHPPNMDSSLMPEPLSPAFPSPVASSHLHPSSARLSHLPSPTNPNFRLSPTVYQMPKPRVSKLVPSLPSTRPTSEASTLSRRYSDRRSNRYSRYASWMPEDDLDIPEDDLEPPRLPRYNSMQASIVQGSEATQTARTSARTSVRKSARQSTQKSRSQSAPRPQSTMTQKSHYSTSWLPDDGLYLPEEGTEDSFKVFRRERLASRPTSYSPLA